MTSLRPSWLTVREVSTQLGVSRMTVYRLVNAGDIPAYRIGSGIRIKPADLDQYLRMVRTWRA